MISPRSFWLVSQRLLDRVEVRSLDIFDNRKFQCCAIVNFPYKNRNFVEACELRRAPSALAGDDFIAAIRCRANHNGLNDAVLANRRRQILKIFFREMFAGVFGVAYHEVDRNLAIGADAWRARHVSDGLVHLADKSGKAAP